MLTCMCFHSSIRKQETRGKRNNSRKNGITKGQKNETSGVYFYALKRMLLLFFNVVDILLNARLFFFIYSFSLAYVYSCDLKQYYFGVAGNGDVGGGIVAACRLWLYGTINEQTIYE